MGKKTPFYELHLQANAKIVDFAGWDMPLHYGSQIQEHHQVRQHAGMFDVSHMGIVDIQGQDAAAYLRSLLANNIDRISFGKALYTCMLNEQGGVIDDLIVYKVSEDFYRVVINAGTREKDLAWMRKQAAFFDINIIERTDLAMIAVQGPEVRNKIGALLKMPAEILQQLKPFSFLVKGDWFIARTGYTGEDGYEMILPVKDANNCWQQLLKLDILPCGFGARAIFFC